MARKKGIPGLSFSWKRALGISQAKGKLSHQIGIPLSKSGRQRKVGRMAGGGCVLPILATLLCLVLLVTASGCATVGRDFDESRVQELVVGESTKADAIALFGPPNTTAITNINDDFKELLMWTYSRIAAFAISTKGKALALTFDKDGVLRGHSSSSMESGL